MKTIRITLTKPDAQVTCTHRYRYQDWPIETTWSGNRAAFEMPSGKQVTLHGGLDRLERVVEFQANLCGAKYTIEDLGGVAIFAIQPICGPEDNPQ